MSNRTLLSHDNSLAFQASLSGSGYLTDIKSSPYYVAALRTFVSLKNNSALHQSNEQVSAVQVLAATADAPEKRQAVLDVFTSQFVEGADVQIKQRYSRYINYSGRSKNLRNPVLQANIDQITAHEEKSSMLPFHVSFLSFTAYRKGQAYGAVNKKTSQIQNIIS